MVWPAGHKVKNGRYVIQEVLGQGGFGITYKAWDTFHYEWVAIKTPNEYLKHDPDYQKYIDRFIKESKRLQRLTKLDHPHIVKFGDFFKERNTYCLVTGFVSGKNFFEIVKERGRLPEKEAVKYIKQIASALAAIHKAGLVHRDAHPGNIILQGDHAILIDFGIAQELVPTTMSSTGEAGNRGFAPYEQMMKGSRERNADVYGLAATLYYLVTGQLPTSSFARKIDKANLIPPRKLGLEVSKDLNKAILKGMELEAKKRPQSVEKWLVLLEQKSPQPVTNWLQWLGRQNLTSKKIVPWLYLGLLFATYVFIGVVLSIVSVSAPIWIISIAVAWAWAWNWTWNCAWTLSMVVAITWTIAVAWAWTWNWAWAVAWLVSVVINAASEELIKYFNKPHIFFVLAITSSLGLGLGGLLGLTYQFLKVK